MDKITWRKIYADFERRHPNLSKMSANFIPYDYAEIFIYLKDGTKLVYNFDTRRVRFNAVPRKSPRPARNSQAVL